MSKLKTATKCDEAVIQLLGGRRFEGNLFTNDQCKMLYKIYGFSKEEDEFIEAGNFRNLMRHVSHDGRRVMAFLSQYLEHGEDPVNLIATALSDQGYDVCVEDLWE